MTQFIEMDIPLMLQGFQDGLQGASPKLSVKEIEEILKALQQHVQNQKKEIFLQVAARNKKEGEEFLKENQKKSGVISLPSGLQYQILQAGSESIHPRLVDRVSLHVKAFLIDGTPIEDTYEKKTPQTAPLDRMIPAWTEALQMMSVGSTWRLFVPPYLAYGEMGVPQEIAPNTTLIFEIELLEIV
jgi:FKBP-type peptidyl-prolyl cis-trans isomerase FklB